MRGVAGLVLVIGVVAFGALALAQGSDDGVIGPANKIQPSGRKLAPAGKLTRVGNHPGGGALTPSGRFYWTLSAGRGRNDVRIVRVAPVRKCRKPKHDASARRKRGYKRCVKRGRRSVGRVVQVLPMPGLSGGIAMARDGRTAYVSGIAESGHADQQSPAGTPGKEGDVIHVLRYNPRTGRASRAGTIAVPPPLDAPIPQNFPPTNTGKKSWPRDLAVSRDGKTLLAALNLADYAAVIDTASHQARFVKVGSYPVRRGDHPRRQVRARVERVRRHRVRDRPRLGDEGEGHPGRAAPLASRGDRDRPQARPRLRGGDGAGPDRGHQPEQPHRRAHAAVERRQGIGTAPVEVNVTSDGCFLL